MKYQKWQIGTASEQDTALLREAGYPSLLATVLAARGITTAEAAAEALEELHVTNHAVITGMDAELAAIKRILAGTQDATIYMDLRELAYAAVDEAYNLATKKKVNVNSELGNDGSNKINAFLINGKVVTRENINKVLIEPGHFTKEDIYSE